jgi:hypothetical protein
MRATGTPAAVIAPLGPTNASGLSFGRGLSAFVVAAGLAMLTILVGAWSGSGRPVRVVAPAHRGLASLPVAARGPVAAALGAGDPAYWVRGFSANNSAQGLRTGFSSDGATIHSGSGWTRLSLSGIGRAGDVRGLGTVAPVVHRNRVTYSYGSVQAWYANGPLGLEQGFDLSQRPAAGAGRVALSMSLSGDLRARLSGAGVRFSGHGASLNYTGLVASDARGRRLPASIALRGGKLVISVDDRGAQYPVRVDPFVQQAELTASDGGENDQLGASVAIDGSTIVAGALNHTVGGVSGVGAVYVFTKKSGWANSTQAAELTATGDAGVGGLGSLVGISGDTVVASSPSDNGADGALYVFVKPAAGWADEHQTAKLTDSHTPNGDHLLGDTGLAILGNTIVADKYDDVGGPSTADVWVEPKTGWVDATETSVLSTTASYAEFAVAMDASTILLGGGDDAVYVFTVPPAGWVSGHIYNQTAVLTATTAADPNEDDGVGASLAISGDGNTIVAGAPGTQGPNPGDVDEGAVFVFQKPASGWSSSVHEAAELTEPAGGFGDSFGASVALSATGATIIASAPGNSLAGYHRGTIYTFAKPAGGWATSAAPSGTMTAADGGTTDSLGHSIAMTGNGTLVAGAFLHEVGSNTTQGAAYVFSVPVVKVSGTVDGTSCSQTQCLLPAGIGGFSVLVQGTASDGDPINETAVSGADGSWSVMAPAGTYTAGLTGDGTTFVSKAMEQSVTVNTAPVTGVNFTSCAGPEGASGAADRSLVAGGVRVPSSRLADESEAAFTPSYCESEYKLTVKAKIPQNIIVDPSKYAHYNTGAKPSDDGYNHSQGFVSALRDFFRAGGGFNEEFPSCLLAGKVALYTKLKVKPEWYSYIKAGTVIGSATVPLVWNQSTQKVELEGVPTTTHGSLTRVFVWRVTLPSGKVESGKCHEKAQVPMQVLPAAGGGEGEGKSSDAAHEEGGEAGGPTSFTVIAAWWLPFDAYGATIDPDTPLAERIVDGTLKLAKGLFAGGGALLERYEHLPAYQKFLVELSVGLAVGAAEEKALVEGPAVLKNFFSGAGVTEKDLEELEVLGSVKKYVERYVQIPLEAAHLYAGYHGYPVMAAVIRGKFTTTKYLPSAEVSPVKAMPYQQTLAVSVQSTKFPNISLEISRDALNTCLSGCTVYQGTLPWASQLAAPETFNPFSKDNAAYFVADSQKTGHFYGSGSDAVKNVTSDTDQTPEVANSIRSKGNLASGFAASEAEAPAPVCDPVDVVTNDPRTICWEFEDWRP